MRRLADELVAELLDRSRTEKMPELAISLRIAPKYAYRLIRRYGHRCPSCRQLLRPVKARPRKKYLLNEERDMEISRSTQRSLGL